VIFGLGVVVATDSVVIAVIKDVLDDEDDSVCEAVWEDTDPAIVVTTTPGSLLTHLLTLQNGAIAGLFISQNSRYT